MLYTQVLEAICSRNLKPHFPQIFSAPILHGWAVPEELIGAESLVRFFKDVQKVCPPPSLQQIHRLLQRVPVPWVAKEHSLSVEAFAQLLCSPGNALADPNKRSLFQDMTLPLVAYFVDTSHNTYLDSREQALSVTRFFSLGLSRCVVEY